MDEMNRRAWLGWVGIVGLLSASLLAPMAAAQEPKVLRYAFEAAESGFDPAQISDFYSATLVAHIFDGLFEYDYLARPYKIRPNVAVALPEVSEDFKTWTVRIRAGIFFAQDPAFRGQRRELVAQDYVYSFKRFFDPALKSPGYTSVSQLGVLGLEALRQRALSSRQPFDYDTEVEGLRALDRYTLQFKLKEARPRFLYSLTGGDGLGALAREVVEFYGDKISEHPVGTGPFKLSTWRRSSLLRLERNPDYRTEVYDAEPMSDDAQGQAWLKQFKGRRLPMVDAVEVHIINESQPRWLSFLNGEFDLLFKLPPEFTPIAIPRGQLAPSLAKRGIQMQRILGADRTYQYFNMDDPLVGGYTPDKVALRRAIALGTDVRSEIQTVRRGQAIVAQSLVSPGSWGFDPELSTEMGEFDPARAQALLDLFGYIDRNGDGWREQPNAEPLVLALATQPDPLSRAFDEHWTQSMKAIGLRVKTTVGQWPEQLKAARAGQLMMWAVGSTDDSPDPQGGVNLLYGPAAGDSNLARFRLPAYDRLVEGMQDLPDGPERLALLREAQKISVAYMPYKFRVHRLVTGLTQPWLVGFRRPVFSRQFWQYIDIEPRSRP